MDVVVVCLPGHAAQCVCLWATVSALLLPDPQAAAAAATCMRVGWRDPQVPQGHPAGPVTCFPKASSLKAHHL